MRKIIPVFGAALMAASALTPAALAATPKAPATFSGGDGRGDSAEFKLAKDHKVTFVSVVTACKGAAEEFNTHAPKLKTGKSGAFTLSYITKPYNHANIPVTLKLAVTFKSSTKAKMVGTFSSSKCGKMPKVTYTLQAS